MRKLLQKVDSVEIEYSQSDKLLEVTIDSLLSFEKHNANI